MLDQLLGDAKSGIVQSLTSKLGIGADQAGGFLGKALSMLEGGITSGNVSPSDVESGNTSGILSKLDLSQLSSFTGGDTGKARSGMETVIGHVTGAVKSAGGVQGLLSKFGAGAGSQGGVMGQVGGMAGKVFGKQQP